MCESAQYPAPSQSHNSDVERYYLYPPLNLFSVSQETLRMQITPRTIVLDQSHCILNLLRRNCRKQSKYKVLLEVFAIENWCARERNFGKYGNSDNQFRSQVFCNAAQAQLHLYIMVAWENGFVNGYFPRLVHRQLNSQYRQLRKTRYFIDFATS